MMLAIAAVAGIAAALFTWGLVRIRRGRSQAFAAALAVR